MNEPRRESRFHVSLHDVAPCWRQEIETILAQLRQRLGSAFSLAVVPAWGGTPLDATNDKAFLETIRRSEAELLLHGYTHQTHRCSPLGWLTGKQNELGGCSVEEASARLLRGRELLERLLENPVVGAVPPAWDHGPMDVEKLHTIGISRQVGLFSLRQRGDRWGWRPAPGTRIERACSRRSGRRLDACSRGLSRRFFRRSCCTRWIYDEGG